jgi:hypothetical protein
VAFLLTYPHARPPHNKSFPIHRLLLITHEPSIASNLLNKRQSHDIGLHQAHVFVTLSLYLHTPHIMAKDPSVPIPGPARLSKGAGPDEWLEQAKQCKYLPEADMKRLCEIVKECLMEGKLKISLIC